MTAGGRGDIYILYFSARHCQGFIQVPQDILYILNPDRQANEVGRDSSSQLVFLGKLLVRCAGGVDNQAARISDVGKVGEEPHAVDDFFTGFVAPLDAKGEDGTSATRQVAPGERV